MSKSSRLLPAAEPAAAPAGHSRILILDFGSQYTQVIARRIRECQVYSQIVAHNLPAVKIAELQPKGIILSGGPASVYGKDAPHPDPAIFDLGIPILGICYGMQLMGHHLGGVVEHATEREYGPGQLELKSKPACPLFAGLGESIDIWNSHGDKLTKLPAGFRAVGRTTNSPFAAIEHPKKQIYGLQFHPEVVHTPRGRELIQNFVYQICQAKMDWTMGSFIEETCAQIRRQVGVDHVLLGLSGGVDSSVAAALVHKAIGDQLTCVFVNNGLLRANEAEAVQRLFGENFHVKLKTVDASAQFLNKLRKVKSPERKRKIIGHEFIRVFDAAVKSVTKARGAKNTSRFQWLAQGTLYPDVIESVAIAGNPAALIKSHHNVGGLPKKMKLKLLEPLRELFKDEVREVGAQLGLPKEVVQRQPFPGPGLAVRILGDITRERLRILRDADTIVVSEMKATDWYYKVWQSFAVLLPVRSVGVMGDERTYENTIALRIVESQDGMTADWVRLPYEVLARISARIINEVKGVNRVCYDISSKPPATIEWE
ncbi:MAG TPA: glutamine-hydrolyzing GMP synthase [Chthoniobacteraceae bacterium]|jgi:GMP synthase (glutamine-hydrolysing)|nr:glutamine-hydrolyzing GMP synthase [Chthoniobacteraceae bacterium]